MKTNTYRMRGKGLLLLAVLLVAVQGLAQPAAREIKLVPLGRVDFETARELADGVLSTNGRLVHVASQGAVMVNDLAVHVAELEAILNQISAATPNIAITVGFQGQRKETHRGAGVTSRDPWEIRVEDGRVRLPPPDGVRVRHQTLEATRGTSMMLLTASGSPATLWVGREEPEWQRIERYFSHPDVRLTRDGHPFVWDSFEREVQKVGAELLVTPRLLASGLIEVSLVPRVTYRTAEGSRALEVETLKTTITVAPGRDVAIGQTVGNDSERLINLFGPGFFADSQGRHLLDMTLRAEVR